jgi:hypothetical protein
VPETTGARETTRTATREAVFSERKKWHDETVAAALAADRKGDMDALRNMLKRFNKRHRQSKWSFTKPVRDGDGNLRGRSRQFQ